MNFKINESEKKLRGSYYTPGWIADFVMRWVKSYGVESILEPSCGDGVFFDAAVNTFREQNLSLVGFDTDAAALEACRTRSSLQSRDITLRNEDFIEWATDNLTAVRPAVFDAVVGNPPFVRYQYLEKQQQDSAQKLFYLLSMQFTKHTNLWIPFVISSIEFLKPGGVIGMVVPAELLHVLYAQGLRDYLLASCNRVLLIDPEDLWFEDTLQGAMLLMAQKKRSPGESASVAIVRTKGKAFASGDPVKMFEQAEYVSENLLAKKWTYALLSREELCAFARVCNSTSVFSFSQLADVDVGIVTGANKFFLVTDDVVKKYSLANRAHPMFGRSEHCPGVIYDEAQHTRNAELGHATNFLYFDGDKDGIDYADYLKTGADQGIPDRYKCRIRDPWYKVPSVFSTPVSMLKRSNGMPRLILNTLGAYTTDTAYRITPKPDIDAATLVVSFLNTMTALSAELEGRYYGGGVLELVPSEIERLIVPYVDNVGAHIEDLDKCVRRMTCPQILEQQDRLLFSGVHDIDIRDIDMLRKALVRLQQRRQRIAVDE